MMKMATNAHLALLEASEGQIRESVWYFHDIIVINIIKTICYYTITSDLNGRKQI